MVRSCPRRLRGFGSRSRSCPARRHHFARARPPRTTAKAFDTRQHGPSACGSRGASALARVSLPSCVRPFWVSNAPDRHADSGFGPEGGLPCGVIVDYCSGGAVRGCVNSLAQEGLSQIVVVDNASQGVRHGSLAGLEELCTVLSPERNLGYGAGANFGSKHTSGGAVLVCNADVNFHPGSVGAMVKALMEDPDRAIVGPRIYNEHGERYPSARRFPDLFDSLGHAFVGLFWPGNPWSRRYTMAEWDHETAREVDWVSGACFLVRREAWEMLGGFDEAYFMYAEDVDLCWRAWRCGWTVVYEPTAEVTHYQGLSTRRHPWKMLLAHHRSLLRFAHKSTTGWRRLLLPIVTAGLGLRLVVTAARALVLKGAARS